MMLTATVNVSLSHALLKTMDQLAKREARSRSELLREAARQYVERRRRWDTLFAFWGREARRTGLKPKDVERAIRHVRAHQRAA